MRSTTMFTKNALHFDQQEIGTMSNTDPTKIMAIKNQRMLTTMRTRKRMDRNRDTRKFGIILRLRRNVAKARNKSYHIHVLKDTED